MIRHFVWEFREQPDSRVVYFLREANGPIAGKCFHVPEAATWAAVASFSVFGRTRKLAATGRLPGVAMAVLERAVRRCSLDLLGVEWVEFNNPYFAPPARRPSARKAAPLNAPLAEESEIP